MAETEEKEKDSKHSFNNFTMDTLYQSPVTTNKAIKKAISWKILTLVMENLPLTLTTEILHTNLFANIKSHRSSKV